MKENLKTSRDECGTGDCQHWMAFSILYTHISR